MTKVLDIHSDLGSKLAHRISLTFKVPEFVKLANVSTPEEVASLPNNAFADPVHRMFPCHDKAHTWWSAAAVGLQKDDMAPNMLKVASTKLQELGKFWNVNVEPLLAVKQEIKSAEAYEYALSLDGIGNFYPINNRENTLSSAEKLVQSRHRIPFALRKQAAINLLLAAEEHNIALPKETERQLTCTSGRNGVNVDGMRSACKTRCYMMKHAVRTGNSRKLSKDAQDLIELVAAISDGDETLIKEASKNADSFVSVVDAFDYAFGLHRDLGVFEDSALSVSKQASMVKLGAVEVPLQKVKDLGYQFLEKIGVSLPTVCTGGSLDHVKLSAKLTPEQVRVIRSVL